MLLHLAKGQAH